MTTSLAGKYKLQTVNGAEAGIVNTVLELTAEAEANQYKLHTRVSNSLNGTVTYADGKLTGLIMSTRKMGPPEFMKVESILKRGFNSGLKADLDGGKLTLSVDEDVLVYAAE